MDQPDMIIKGALENHYKMIKQMKGVPGIVHRIDPLDCSN